MEVDSSAENSSIQAHELQEGSLQQAELEAARKSTLMELEYRVPAAVSPAPVVCVVLVEQSSPPHRLFVGSPPYFFFRTDSHRFHRFRLVRAD